MRENQRRGSGAEFFILERERKRLLSKIPANPTIGILHSMKESRSTRRALRVGSGFEVFRQTP